jgi:hypothetical protein
MGGNLEIIICTEGGRLEPMSKLLIYTIRNFCGAYKDTPIFSYQPRKEYPVSEETKRFFERNSVNFVDIPLNTEYPDYPLANKPNVCAYHEKNTTADHLLFIDSDTFFIKEPDLINDIGGAEVALRPVDSENIATDLNFSKGEKEYWRALYDLLNVGRQTSIKTSVTRKEVLEYYNSGFILSKAKTGLFQDWLSNFNTTMQQGLKPKKGLFFVEQSVFSATVAQKALNVKILGNEYNFPVKTYAIKWRGFYPFSLRNVKHVHYHKLFQKAKRKNPIEKKLNTMENGPEINDQIRALKLV